MGTPVDALLDGVSWKSVPAPVPGQDGIPYATHVGVVLLLGHELKVAKLSTGERIIDADDLARLFRGF